MAKAEFGTPKFISNQMKAKGLQKLKWYCQVCEKQCRDDNGFKSHVRSESHLKKIQNVGVQDIEKYSNEFKKNFISNLRNYHGEKSINANKFYNQLIQQKDHVHLNSTKWSSLSRFLQELGRQGIINIKVINEEDTSLNGIDISYINNSGDEIMRKSILKTKNEAEKNEGLIGMKLLQQQIKRGQQQTKDEKPLEDTFKEGPEQKLHDKPITIKLNTTKKQPLKVNAFKVSKPNPLKSNPLKSNPLKQNPLKSPSK